MVLTPAESAASWEIYKLFPGEHFFIPPAPTRPLPAALVFILDGDLALDGPLLHPAHHGRGRVQLELDGAISVMARLNSRLGLEVRQHLAFTLRNAQPHA